MHIHILGICGTFMGGLAAIAREAGFTVTGCDAGVYPPMSDQLAALGIELVEGFEVAQLETLSSPPDLFVVGNVVSRARQSDGSPKFPLMEHILDEGLPYTSGPAWLREHVLRDRHVLAVAGTHGKTTTSAMLTWVLMAAGLEPGFLIGGVPLNFGVSARLGAHAPQEKRPYFVIEADEYDTAFFDKRSKFVHYAPRTAILNNLEFDHADIFDNLAAIERQFAHLLRTIPSSGRVVVEANNDALKRVMEQGLYCSADTFGVADANWQAHGNDSRFDVFHQGTQVGTVEWKLTGAHNQRNALACIAAANHIGIPAATACESLGRFENVRRRMELRGRVSTPTGDIHVIDDFAHHPTAIKTTVLGLRQQLDRAGTAARILAVFEPRSNTMKTGAMKDLLPASLSDVEMAFCFTQGLSWDAKTVLAPLGERAVCEDQIDALVTQVCEKAQPNDRILCMSNGGFSGVHDRLLTQLKKRFTQEA